MWDIFVSFGIAGDRCIHSLVGHEYTGTKTVSKSGRQCLLWEDNFSFFNKTDFDSIKTVFPDNTIKTLRNNCRYLNIKDSTFPSCIVSTPEMGITLEHCEIERCGRFFLPIYHNTAGYMRVEPVSKWYIV